MAISRRLLLTGVGAAASAVALSACSSSSDSDKSTTAASSSGGSYPVTITHAKGTLSLDAKPERVVVFDLGVLDSMVALGVEDSVVGVPQNEVRYPDSLSKFGGSQYTNVGTLFEPDVEAIAGLDPDLVIVANRTASSYEALSGQFPTIDASAAATDSSASASGSAGGGQQSSAGGSRQSAGGGSGQGGEGRNSSVEMTASLQNLVDILGPAFGVQSAAQAKLDEFTTAAAEVKSIAADKGTGLAIMTNGDAVSAFGAGSRFDVIFNEFGVKQAVDDVSAQTHGEAISFEFIANANPGMLFVLDRTATIGQEGTAAADLLNNDLVNGTDAAKNGRIFYLNGPSWYVIGAGLGNSLNEAAEIKADLQK